jgi:hypothetical protein
MHSSTKVRIALGSLVLLNAPVSGHPLGRIVRSSLTEIDTDWASGTREQRAFYVQVSMPMRLLDASRE